MFGLRPATAPMPDGSSRRGAGIARSRRPPSFPVRRPSPCTRGGAAQARGAILSGMRLLLKWLLSAAALLFVAYIYSGVEVKSFTSALVAAFIIGLFNVVLRPVLVVLTLPVTIVTLGLFLFVINALMFWAAASVLGDGFQVRGFGAALIGSLIYSVLGILIESALGGLFLKK